MNQDESHYLPLKVTNIGNKGKRTFDPEAKRLLIEACLVPGASISGLALKAGVNANQLHKWIRDSQRPEVDAAIRDEEVAPSAFVPVIALDNIVRPAAKCETARSSAERNVPARLSAELPNGVTMAFEFGSGDIGLMRAMIEMLGTCRCSG